MKLNWNFQRGVCVCVLGGGGMEYFLEPHIAHDSKIHMLKKTFI